MMLDGSRAWPEVVKKLKPVAASRIIENCIRKLFDTGIIIEEFEHKKYEKEIPGMFYRFLSNAQRNPQDLLDLIGSATIGIISQVDIGIPVLYSLQKHGFRNFKLFNTLVSGSDDNSLAVEDISTIKIMPFSIHELDEQSTSIDLLISLLPHLDASQLDELNRQCVENSIPWLPVDIYGGPFCSIGPLVIPGGGPCYECFRSRLRSNLGNLADSYDEFLRFQRFSKINVTSYGIIPAAVDMVSAAISLEAFKLISEIQVPSSLGHNLMIDLMTLETKRDRVLQIPRCSACFNSKKSSKGHWEL